VIHARTYRPDERRRDEEERETPVSVARDFIRRRGRMVLVQRHVFGRAERKPREGGHHDHRDERQRRLGTSAAADSSSPSKGKVVPVVGFTLETRAQGHRVAVFVARTQVERAAIAQEEIREEAEVIG